MAQMCRTREEASRGAVVGGRFLRHPGLPGLFHVTTLPRPSQSQQLGGLPSPPAASPSCLWGGAGQLENSCRAGTGACNCRKHLLAWGGGGLGARLGAAFSSVPCLQAFDPQTQDQTNKQIKRQTKKLPASKDTLGPRAPCLKLALSSQPLSHVETLSF